MDWRIPEKLKKGVSYARFLIALRSMNDNVKGLVVANQPTTTKVCVHNMVSVRLDLTPDHSSTSP